MATMPKLEAQVTVTQAQPTPGWKTSEFWTTIAVVALCAYVAADLSRPTSQVIAAIAAAVIKAGWYLGKRTALKMPDGAP